MKQKAMIAALAVLGLFLVYFFGTGFVKNTSAFPGEFYVSADGEEITLHLQVSSSAGYLRAVSVHWQEHGVLELDCYAAFGGVNGAIGAKHVFTVPLDADTTAIAVCRGGSAYETVLEKGADGVWHRA